MPVGFDMRGQHEMECFVLEEILLWIMDQYFGQKLYFRVRTP